MMSTLGSLVMNLESVIIGNICSGMYIQMFRIQFKEKRAFKPGSTLFKTHNFP